MTDFDNNTEILFDRLVDGELSADERRQLLASLDDRPGGWRACALAFLEAQSWRTDLGQVVREASLPRPTTTTTSPTAETHRFAGRRALGWLAIAATVAIAFNAGLWWQPSDDLTGAGGSTTSQIAGGLTEQPTAPSVTSPAHTPSRDALTLWVKGDAGATPVHVPLVDAGTLDRQLGVKFRSGVPDAVRDHLRQNGYNVESTRRYAPLWLDNGRSLVVPVEDTRIVPVSQVVY